MWAPIEDKDHVLLIFVPLSVYLAKIHGLVNEWVHVYKS